MEYQLVRNQKHYHSRNLQTPHIFIFIVATNNHKIQLIKLKINHQKQLLPLKKDAQVLFLLLLIATDEGVDYTVYTGVNKLLSGF